MNYEIRRMRRQDLDTAIEWAALEGWNPGLNDAEVFYNTDPQGFFMAWQGSEAIGSVSGVKYPQQSFGFFGLFIVKKAFRGQGVGTALKDCALEYLAECNNGLDGVMEKVDYYQRFGFHQAYKNIRYGGRIAGNSRFEPAPELLPVGEVPFTKINAYDHQVFPADRPQFLRDWLIMPQARGLACYDGRALHGYGVIRKSRDGYRIGPLFADDGNIAEKLFLGLVKDIGDANVFLDIPDACTAAVSLAEKYGLAPVFATARMYSQEAPRVDLQKMFGVTTFELG
ncbi:GNAT family N-acetyltransferase [Candidatus Methylospira mobilis]|uniref:GNAT family N-acetyltransferase n=1 Tax=Candidatus Methylospira mobilis TaxID=1808979 RepID=UPI0028EF54F6|nr:GNAT family N-acetyltransferase [Candidatus Methylospira mobilis]WNV03804.1 GNAT family N-acetyltransferase [Candidatus Methylospira mobilis]